MNTKKSDITIVVPTLNEVGNVAPLTKRIDSSMKHAGISYNVLFIDDHSTDGTTDEVRSLSRYFPVSYELKDGIRGKAQSIIQGSNRADTKFVCMIDADLQYPPEDIPKMVQKLKRHDADVALSRRHDSEAGWLRNLFSKSFNLIFIRLLFGINYDTQSGLKVFTKSTFDAMKLHPSPWSFDLEFILTCLERQQRVLTHDIQFGKRTSGEAKVDMLKTSFELAKSSIKLRFAKSSTSKLIRGAYSKNIARYAQAR